MLATLSDVSNPTRVVLNDGFQRDLAWLKKFLPQYNGVSMYAYKKSDSTLELDACLTGLGGHWGQYVYHLPISRSFTNMDREHLEMVNIVVALRLFAHSWSGTRVLIKCDNDAVVKGLNTGKARDPFLGACARNVWYLAALADVTLQYIHVLGENNTVADLLSRWQYSDQNMAELKCFIENPVWLPVNIAMMDIDYTI